MIFNISVIFNRTVYQLCDGEISVKVKLLFKIRQQRLASDRL